MLIILACLLTSAGRFYISFRESTSLGTDSWVYLYEIMKSSNIHVRKSKSYHILSCLTGLLFLQIHCGLCKRWLKKHFNYSLNSLFSWDTLQKIQCLNVNSRIVNYLKRSFSLSKNAVRENTHYLLCKPTSLGIEGTPWWFSQYHRQLFFLYCSLEYQKYSLGLFNFNLFCNLDLVLLSLNSLLVL